MFNTEPYYIAHKIFQKNDPYLLNGMKTMWSQFEKKKKTKLKP